MRRGLLFALVCSTAGATDHAMESLLSHALQRNPAVLAATAQAEAAQQDIEVAKLGRWPAIQVTGDANTSFTGSALVVEQALWSAGAITARIEEAKRLADVGQAQIDVSRVQLALRMVDAWQSLMEASAALEVHRESLRHYDRYEALMRRRVEAQVSATIELQLLASRTIQARIDANEAGVLQRVALVRLEQMLGDRISPSHLVQLAQTVEAQTLQAAATAEHLEILLTRLDQHPSVRRARFEAAVASERMTQQRALAWPQVVLRYRRQLSGAVAAGTQRDQIGLALNYAPGAGFSNLARVGADAQRLLGYQLASEAMAHDIHEQLRVEWEGLRRDMERHSIQRQVVGGAHEVLASYERQFVAGRKSWLDVLNALRELTQSDIRRTQALASASAGLYRLRLRSGALPGDPQWKVQP